MNWFDVSKNSAHVPTSYWSKAPGLMLEDFLLEQGQKWPTSDLGRIQQLYLPRSLHERHERVIADEFMLRPASSLGFEVEFHDELWK